MNKQSPQAIELEAVIIGACLQDKNSYLKVAELLSTETFYKDEHRIIWDALSNSFNEGRPTDLLSITHSLRQMGQLESIGGALFVTQLTNKATNTENIERHAMMVKQTWMLREIATLSLQAASDAYKGGTDPFELMGKITSTIDVIGASIDKSKELPFKMQLKNTVKEMEDAKLMGYQVGKSTGFRELDKTGGLVKGDFIVLGARPSMGKSALGVQIGVNVAYQYDEPVLFFEMEMTHKQLIKREISRQTNIPHYNIRRGEVNELDWQNINRVVGKLSDSKIEIYDTPRQPLSYMRRKLMQCVNKHGGVGLVIIDFLQLAETDEVKKNGTREQEISRISRGFKALAKEFDVPVIAIASLSREVEKRTDKRPIVSDLRESGQIESDADKIWLLYRPEFYGITELEDGSSSVGVAVIDQPKNRSGETGTIHLQFHGETVSFSDKSLF